MKTFNYYAVILKQVYNYTLQPDEFAKIEIFVEKYKYPVDDCLNINCINCSNSYLLINCNNCFKCSNCSYCNDCSFCKNCESCENCIDCSECSDCDNCNRCENSKYLIDESKRINKVYCRICKKFVDINNSCKHYLSSDDENDECYHDDYYHDYYYYSSDDD